MVGDQSKRFDNKLANTRGWEVIWSQVITMVRQDQSGDLRPYHFLAECGGQFIEYWGRVLYQDWAIYVLYNNTSFILLLF